MKLGKVWIFIALVYVVTSLKCENVNNKKNGNNVERNSEIDNMNREQILENNINEAHRKIKECENQKNELAIQIKNVQNSLYKYTENNKNELNLCISQMSKTENLFKKCKEKELKHSEEIKNITNEYKENLNKKENEKKNFEDKISNLEIKIANAEYKLNNCNKKYENYYYNNGYENAENYLISYDMIKGYFYKIYKIYKTIYIIIIENTYLFEIFNKIYIIYYNLIKYAKMYGTLAISRIYEFYEFILNNNITNIIINIYNNYISKYYHLFLKNKVNNSILSPSYDLILKHIKNIIPILLTLKDGYFKYVEYFVQKLNINAENLVNKINTINPELKGIIPTNLLDQIIFLLFFTIVNFIHIYILFYIIYISFKYSIKTITCLLGWIWFFISSIFQLIIFILTLPIRPFIPKKNHKNRKIYRRHDDNAYDNSERLSYQQHEYKKLYKSQNAYQRKF
ncbi:conserved Plasmodium protein, unknown function [Plasmodium berghei]|uniref:Akratin n=2 Tax=Plasmodium berghei TaxID=5821 RepID=AKR_PLABA|nr:conserved Plasmodium protein, unknown function [Plasmodium berghei ANKA]CXI60115.1 conserved Plasmodium protein, unknown function [Plasmodium berghei]SCM23536.1 conserved Plasmodium protein, unknown function [Plasmodium berghei]SCN26640.1 conserved Plasmodium protein, unknown function [Plasmodium berghei]SCO60906.1 conserved Plasmodium protein, unknown function [Plasmodium berghei]SCO62930.1 conserved Plasmodium protein, unknown function [Plasmodium berghei]|eukprot:XP_034422262.1 conserved Plasmodium protein, unknown function [Plasmodium berghei ANKA]